MRGVRTVIVASLCGVQAIALLLAEPRSAPAQPLPPGCSVSGSRARCEGDLSGGVSSTDGSIDRIEVRNLTVDIAPPSDVSGIELSDEVGEDLAVEFEGEQFGIGTRGDAAEGVRVESRGLATESIDLGGLPFPIGQGGPGGSADVESRGAITTTGPNSHAISARSSSGGFTDELSERLGDLLGTGLSERFVVTSVDGEIGNLGQDVPGTQGGSFVLRFDGSYAVDLGTDFDDLPEGESVVTAVQYTVTSGNRAGPDSQAVLEVRVTRTADGLEALPGTFFSEYGASRSEHAAVTLRPDIDAFLAQQLRDSGVGGDGDDVTVVSEGALETSGPSSHGIFAQSRGGDGAGGSGGFFNGGDGERGADAGVVDVTRSGAITTHGASSHGIVARSIAGDGGNGGGSGLAGEGGDGGAGGDAGPVNVRVADTGDIRTEGVAAPGILAQSLGGSGGRGGTGGFLGGSGGAGGDTGDAGAVRVENAGDIDTASSDSQGIFAQSVGGFAGSGGTGIGIIAFGGSGGSAGDGGRVTVLNDGVIATEGDRSHGIFTESVGGGGGSAGAAGGLVALGGDGQAGGDGGSVAVTNRGRIETDGLDARGIHAQSVGGGGGDGGGSGGLVSVGGDGSATGNGGRVAVTNSGAIRAQGVGAQAIFAQSVGGGGGSGGSSGGVFSFGGDGESGGDGAEVTVGNTARLETAGDDASAIFGQTVGGGGGNGGLAGSVSLGTISLAVGGSGGPGGDGGVLRIETGEGEIVTGGDRSAGIHAQSAGGGGGNGGFAFSVSRNALLGLAVGGRGSDGGDGGDVVVDSASDIATAGTHSHGIEAQSVGGGGGSGGGAVSAGQLDLANLSIGGSAGGGGDGRAVRVTSSGDIDTGGEEAHGVFAQSVGGGGGSGGFAVTGSLVGGVGGVRASFGGSGGGGGSGSTVDVGTPSAPLGGTITTAGEGARGVLAQSVGGGGGDGGFSVTATAVTGSGVNLSVGGSGGGGGDGGRVNVHGAGRITTTGEEAHAVEAQSVGGGGGNGGFAVTGQLDGGVSLNLAIGGSGGAGGSGGDVRVGSEGRPLTGELTTAGDQAHGVYAQSVGGGGGDGGLAVSGALFPAATIGLALGGKGGRGNRGGTVQVESNAAVTTTGEQSHGIFAESVGGGGGNGGLGLSAAVTAFGGLQLGMGGDGGVGNRGGAVDVHNDGAIVTEDEYSHGIFAQSTGGGGGAGGSSGAAMVNFSSLIPVPPEIPITGSANFAIAIGGDGGRGGRGGAVDVDNTGGIATREDFSHGVYAQSVGGGGGDGGKAIAATANISAPEIPTGDDGGGSGGDTRPQIEVQVDFALAVGGRGGDGNQGNRVDVANQGGIETAGEGSHGIFAQSVGGGGGNGGDARALTVNVDPVNAITPEELSDLIDLGMDPFSVSKTVNIAVGGRAGGGSDGGEVAIENSGSTRTRGPDAHGIFAQSIGGGGGNGGGGYHGLDLADLGVPEDLVPIIEANPAFGIVEDVEDATIVVGGSAGSSGSGDDLRIANVGDLETLGAGSYGVLAQSIGGGGGNGGVGARGEGDVGIGGSGGAAGDGGDVDLELDGRIDTHATAAHGVVAQSIGGGGGIAGNVDGGISDFGLNLSFGRGGGSAGDGGRIDVEGSGDVTTRGDGANGILLQSIGGGGGLAGDLADGIGFAGSAGGDGSGGEIRLAHEGRITTRGDVSHGILAQSAGGENDRVFQMQTILDENGQLAKNAAGNPIFTLPVLLRDLPDVGGDVDLEVTGDVVAEGDGSHAIVAQSVGDDGNGDLSVTLVGGRVRGGAGEGVGVLLADGDDNRLRNGGTLSALSGTAIRAGGGNDLVQNTGLVVGNVVLGTGINAFANHDGAELRAGSSIDLGGGLLSNQGRLVHSRETSSLTTAVTGHFYQSGGGSYLARVNPDDSADRLAVSGSATLGGGLIVRRSRGLYRDGSHDVLTAGAGIAPGSDFERETLPNTPLLRFSATTLADRVRVDVSAAPFSSVATNDVGQVVSGYLDRLVPLVQGGSPPATTSLALVSPAVRSELEVMLGDFQALGAGQFDAALTSVSSSTVDDVSTASFTAARTFSRISHQRMLDLRSQSAWLDEVARAPAGGDGVDVAAGPAELPPIGVWLNSFGEWGDMDARDGYGNSDFDTIGFGLGADLPLGRGWLAGVNGGLAWTDQDFDGTGGHADIDHGFVSAYGSWTGERVYLEQVLSYGRNDNDTARSIRVGPTSRRAKGDYDTDTWSSYSEAGYRFGLGRVVAEPFAALLWARLEEDGYKEKGAGSLGLDVDSRGIDSLQSDVGLRLRGRIPVGESILIPRLSVAWNHDFDVDDRDVQSGFRGAPTYSLRGREVNRNGARLGADLRFVSQGGFTATVNVQSEVRDDYRSAGGRLELGWTF